MELEVVLDENQNLLCLPNELLEEIWMTDCLSCPDICRLAVVCQKFKDISNSKNVWKRLFRCRWGFLGFMRERDKNTSCDWHAEYQFYHEISSQGLIEVDKMSPRLFGKTDISSDDLFNFTQLLNKRENVDVCLTEDLISMLQDGNSFSNLTRKFYAAIALEHVHHHLIIRELEQYLRKEPRHQLLEEGASLLAGWFQPTENIALLSIPREIDRLSERVQNELTRANLGHPFENCLSLHNSHHDLTSSKWSPKDCKVILHALNKVMFEDEKFTGNQDAYYTCENSFIDKVLKNKKGIPITLCIVYQAVARRLGVLLQPVNFPSHFLLRWKENPNERLTESEQHTYIDVYNGGKFLARHQCHTVCDSVMMPHSPRPESNLYDVCQTKTVLQRMVRNLLHIGRQQVAGGDTWLLRHSLELSLLLGPNESSHERLMLIQLYIHQGINLSQVRDMMQALPSHELPPGPVTLLLDRTQSLIEEQRNTDYSKITPKRRAENPDVDFTVGMVMVHRRYNYKCVIAGWDEKCEASDEWVLQMGVHLLEKKDDQPFYNVLVDDGSTRYAAQENIDIHPEPTMIKHKEIGRYFDEFASNHFICNVQNAEKYPDDAEALARILEESYSNT